jgi:hypothetical protein
VRLFLAAFPLDGVLDVLGLLRQGCSLLPSLSMACLMSWAFFANCCSHVSRFRPSDDGRDAPCLRLLLLATLTSPPMAQNTPTTTINRMFGTVEKVDP